MNTESTITIYTDGACPNNQSPFTTPGGWGVYMMQDEIITEIYGGEPDTTNQRMELTAAIKALEHLPEETTSVTLISDSQYVVKGITEWIDGWLDRGWITATKGEVKNQDLWERLLELDNKHDVTWQWVRGHSGDPGNDAADALAVRGAMEARDETLASHPF